MLGKARVMLQCKEGMRIYTTVYVVAGQTENLLGERDAVALGILSIKPRGIKPNQESVRNITTVKKEPRETGEMSGGQTQIEIDQDMSSILHQFKDMFSGIGDIKLPPLENP